MKKLFAVIAIVPMILMFFSGLSGVSADSSSKTVPYVCNADLSGTVLEIHMEMEIFGTTPDSVEPNKEFQITDSYTVTTMDETATTALKAVANPLTGQVTKFELNVDNAVNPTDNSNVVNVASTPIDIPETLIGEDAKTVSFRVPESGFQTVNLKASDGGTITIKAGQVDTTMNTMLGEVNASCNPAEGADTTLNVIQIEESSEEDTVAPVITLNGDNPMELEVGDAFVDPGATATDDVDGDLTDAIVVTGDVDTSVAGTYTVTYTVSDAAGNEARAERIVHVVEPDEEPEEPIREGGYWLTGEGAPDSDQGNEGDLYLDKTNFNVYEKGENGWVLIGNLKGEDGQDGQDGQDGRDGATWLVGDGAPGSDDGKVGDLYMDKASGDVYVKYDDGWKLEANLKGPQGPKGEDGKDGECKCENEEPTGDSKDKDGSDEKTGGNNSNNGKGGKLPDTATNNPLFVLLGSLMAIAGGTLFFFRKKVSL